MAIAALALAACVSPAERDAQHVLAAIERLRVSDATTRSRELEAIERLRSDVPPAESARAACAAAYRALDNVQKLIAAAKAGGGIDRTKLDAAQGQLATARSKIDECTVTTGELRRWLKKN